jgi:hypothetical protein
MLESKAKDILSLFFSKLIVSVIKKSDFQLKNRRLGFLKKTVKDNPRYINGIIGKNTYNKIKIFSEFLELNLLRNKAGLGITIFLFNNNLES